MSIVVNAFLTAALAEIRVARAGDVVNPDDMGLALMIFNEYLDALNADGRALFANTFQTFTLTPNLQPHTIGLAANTPTFAVPIGRPVSIQQANMVLANNIRVPLALIDDQAWGNIRAGAAQGQAITITSTIDRVLYYSSDWPNGSIYLWPVPSAANGLELVFETLLAAVALTDTLDLPMGYQQALRLTLAELLAPSFGQQVSPSTAMKAAEARGRVWANNDTIPTLVTRDAGMPGGGSRRGYFDYRTGLTT